MTEPPNRPITPWVTTMAAHDGREARDRADRDVERAADDDDRLADGEQTDDHDALGEAVHQVLP